MNLANRTPDTIEFEYHEDVWQQNIDYEHIPFRCHVHWHLAKECPITREEEESRSPPQKKRETIDQEEYQEVKNKRKVNKEIPQKRRKEKQSAPEKPNSFAVLQVEDEEEDQPMENQEDKGSDSSESSKRNHSKRKAPSEPTEKGKEQDEQDEQAEHMETDQENNKEDLSQEEEVLRKLLNEWKNLDERFILEEQKRLYAETF